MLLVLAQSCQSSNMNILTMIWTCLTQHNKFLQFQKNIFTLFCFVFQQNSVNIFHNYYSHNLFVHGFQKLAKFAYHVLLTFLSGDSLIKQENIINQFFWDTPSLESSLVLNHQSNVGSNRNKRPYHFFRFHSISTFASVIFAIEFISLFNDLITLKNNLFRICQLFTTIV